MYNILIIGAGKISVGFDKPNSEEVLTYAHAFSKNIKTQSICLMDINLDNLEKAKKTWGCKIYSSMEDVFNENRIDIVVIATPDEYHYEYMKKLYEKSWKLMVVEKPVVTSEGEAQEIMELYENNKKIIVNYTRRFVPGIKNIKNNILSMKYGNFIGGMGYYGKGFLHNGSHMIDLLEFLIGKSVFLEKTIDEIDDYGKDKSKSVILGIEKGSSKFIMKSIDSKLYTIFEMDLFFEKGRIRFINGGEVVEIYETKESELYSGYINLDKKISINTNLKNGMKFLIEHIYNVVENKEDIISDLENACKKVILCTN